MNPMPLVTICDLYVHPRVVEIPPVCPRCEGELTEHDALGVWSYTDEHRPGRLFSHADGEVEEGGVVVNYEGDVTGGESFLPTVALSCERCGQQIVEGVVRSFDDEPRGD
jgi:hypothetical protein